MTQHGGPPDGEESTAALVALALRLRAAAIEAGRRDVAAKTDEALALLTGGDSPVQEVKRGQGRGGDALLRTLDGLGF